jgi:hypothetical protein
MVALRPWQEELNAAARQRLRPTPSTRRQPPTHRSRALGKLLLPPIHHRDPPTHAAWGPSFNRVLVRPPRCSDKGDLTLRSHNPFFRSSEVRATPSGTPRIASGSRTVTTVPSSVRRRVIVDAQRWQSQKYSTLDSDERNAGSLSRRKSLPSLRERNEAEHEGLLHLATITALH